ncbi:uncharacterized protein LOC100243531 [Vitis vinifera]|nr:uncharacterized protein LOC100243531 [Vitis vinifera]|eukprot:XP_002267001.1 PREDICTED: uncharacterized protein LOC100243531 [Vitis vinifera]
MEMDKEDDGIPNPSPSPSPNPNPNPVRGSKGKSCKGCLYYSSILKSKSQNPRCIGISRTLHQVPSYIVGESELEASKEGRSLTDFRYACAGYSVYLDNKNPSADQEEKQAELPFCVGLEVLLDKRTSPAHHGSANHVPAHHGSANHVPAPAQRREDSHAFPQPRPYKPPHSTGNEYLNRFVRNASLVASGVARNVNKVGNYLKESLDDILYPYRRRPK